MGEFMRRILAATQNTVKKIPKRMRIPLLILALVTAAFLSVFLILRSVITLPPSYPLPDASVFYPPSSASSPPTQTDTPDKSGDPAESASPAPDKKDPDLVYRILLAVTDQEDYLTDALMVANVNCTQKKVTILNIPRDTYSATALRANKKINSAYAGNKPERMMGEVTALLGFAPDYYVIASLQGVAEMVDLIGGVTFNVPIDMDYDDPTQDLYIHFQKGEQKLNGEDAVKVLRFRKAAGYEDFGRIETAQAFIKTYVKQALTIKKFFELQKLPKIYEKNVKSDLIWWEILLIAAELDGLDGESSITSFTLPTTTQIIDDIDYQVLEEEASREMIRKVFAGDS